MIWQQFRAYLIFVRNAVTVKFLAECKNIPEKKEKITVLDFPIFFIPFILGKFYVIFGIFCSLPFLLVYTQRTDPEKSRDFIFINSKDHVRACWWQMKRKLKTLEITA